MKTKEKEYFITSGLKNILTQIRENSSQAQLVNIEIQTAQAMDFYRQQTRNIPMKFRPDSEHAAIDETIKSRDLFAEASCKKGCSFCCHVNVQVTNAEARQLADLIKSGTVNIDVNLLREQAAFTGNDWDYTTQPREKNKCIFLGEDKSCQIYEKRPTNCRKYLVRSDPSECEKGPGGMPQVLASIEVEAMASGFADLDKNFDPMPKSILRYLEE